MSGSQGPDRRPYVSSPFQHLFPGLAAASADTPPRSGQFRAEYRDPVQRGATRTSPDPGVQYAIVAAEIVPPDVRAAAEEALKIATWELALHPAPTLSWVMGLAGAQKAGATILGTRVAGLAVAGFVDNTDPSRIFVRLQADPIAAAETAAHESAHVAQAVYRGGPPTSAADRADGEARATAYGLHVAGAIRQRRARDFLARPR